MEALPHRPSGILELSQVDYTRPQNPVNMAFNYTTFKYV